MRGLREGVVSSESALRDQVRDAKEKRRAYRALVGAYEEEIGRLRGTITGLQVPERRGVELPKATPEFLALPFMDRTSAGAKATRPIL